MQFSIRTYRARTMSIIPVITILFATWCCRFVIGGSNIDECDSSGCQPNASCVHTSGSAECHCATKFSVEDGVPCTDTDECTTQLVCDRYGFCYTVSGFSGCHCNFGSLGDTFQCNGHNVCHPHPCSANATCSYVNETTVCDCFPGYTGNGLECIEIDCGLPPILSNGKILLHDSGETSNGTNASVLCEQGFISAVDTVTCQSSGLWDPIPICQTRDCGTDLPMLDHGTMVLAIPGETTFAAEATVICNTTYFSNKTSIFCLATGEWDQAVECVFKDCGIPGNMENGEISYNNTAYGSKAIYSCDIGYALNGDSLLECQPDETWSGTTPVCSIRKCEYPAIIKNGQVSYTSTEYGSVANYSCYIGYELQGHALLECQLNETWSGTPPLCSIQITPSTRCEKEVYATYDLIWSAQQIGKTSSKQCPSGFTGTVTRTCKDDGEWSQTNYSCIRKYVTDIQNKASTLNQNSSSEDIADILNELSDISNISTVNNNTDTDLTQSEVQVLADTLETLAGVIEVDKVTDKVSDDFIAVANNLIAEENSDTWTKTENGAEAVLAAVDKYANTLSKSLATSNQTKNVIIKTNIVVEIRKVGNNSNFVFPNTSDAEEYKEDWVRNSSSGVLLRSDNLQEVPVYITRSSIYRNMTGILPTSQGNDRSSSNTREINGPVLALSVDPPLGRLSPPVTLTFQHEKRGLRNVTCNFWKFSSNESGYWSTKGCDVVSSNDTITVCECDHLTNFAVLMSPFQAADAHSLPLRIISIVGISVSILGLIVTMSLHLFLWRYVKSDRVMILINLCIALLASYLIFIGGVDRTESRESCAAVAAMLQYIYLVVFFVMLAEGIEISSSVLFVFSKISKGKILLILAWFLPAVIVGVSLGITKAEGYGNEDFCWLSIESGLIWAFVGPALTIISFNMVCLIVVMRVMFNTKTMAQKKNKEKLTTSVRSLCVLMPLMGVTWIIGIFHINGSFYWIQYMFAICNGLQGFFICLIHCVFNPQIKRALAIRQKRKSSTTFSSSTSKKANQTKRTSTMKVSERDANHSSSEQTSGMNNKSQNNVQKSIKDDTSLNNNSTKPLSQGHRSDDRKAIPLITDTQGPDCDPGRVASAVNGSKNRTRRHAIINTDDLPRSQM